MQNVSNIASAWCCFLHENAFLDGRLGIGVDEDPGERREVLRGECVVGRQLWEDADRGFTWLVLSVSLKPDGDVETYRQKESFFNTRHPDANVLVLETFGEVRFYLAWLDVRIAPLVDLFHQPAVCPRESSCLFVAVFEFQFDGLLLLPERVFVRVVAPVVWY